MFSRIEIGKYFKAEKVESFILIAIGIVAIVLAIVFFFALKTDFYKGAALSLALTGIPIVISRFIFFTRYDILHVDNLHNIEMNSSVFKNIELPRMRSMIKQTIIFRNVRVVLLLAGIFLYCYSCKGFQSVFLQGLGFYLAIMSLIMLIADTITIIRSSGYLKNLESFTSSK